MFSGWGFYRRGLLFAAAWDGEFRFRTRQDGRWKYEIADRELLGRPDDLVSVARAILARLEAEPAAGRPRKRSNAARRGQRHLPDYSARMEPYPGVFVSSLSATAWEPDPEVGGEMHVLCGGLGGEWGVAGGRGGGCRFPPGPRSLSGGPCPAGRLFWSWKARRESRLTMDRCWS